MATSHTSLIDNARIFFLWEYLFSVHAKSSGPWTHLGLEMEWRILALHCYNLGHFFQTSRDLSGYLSQPINLSIHHQSTLSIYLSINMSIIDLSNYLSSIYLLWIYTSCIFIYISVCFLFFVLFCFFDIISLLFGIYGTRVSEVKSLSGVWLFGISWTVSYQAPLSMKFSRQEYWSGCFVFLITDQ